MLTKEIQLGGKTVTLGYCYATEISFKILSENDIQPFMLEAVQALSENRMPDTKKCVYLILAAAMAYAESKEQDSPIDSKFLIYEASPTELGTALGSIIGLWSEFYELPKGEEPKEKKKKGRNKKN